MSKSVFNSAGLGALCLCLCLSRRSLAKADGQKQKNPAEQTQFQNALKPYQYNHLTPVFGFLAVFGGMGFGNRSKVAEVSSGKLQAASSRLAAVRIRMIGYLH